MSKGKFLVGAGVGAAVALLFTTEKGAEIREGIANKAKELIDKAKNVDSKEVKENIEKKVKEIKAELADLDKEKVKKIAKEKAELIKVKTEDLVSYAKEKGTPVLEKTAKDLKAETVKVIKKVLEKLED